MGVEGDFDEETARLSARVAAAERRDALGGGGRDERERRTRSRMRREFISWKRSMRGRADARPNEFASKRRDECGWDDTRSTWTSGTTRS